MTDPGMIIATNQPRISSAGRSRPSTANRKTVENMPSVEKSNQNTNEKFRGHGNYLLLFNSKLYSNFISSL